MGCAGAAAVGCGRSVTREGATVDESSADGEDDAKGHGSCENSGHAIRKFQLIDVKRCVGR